MQSITKKKTAKMISRTPKMILIGPYLDQPYALSTRMRMPAASRVRLPRRTAPIAIILGMI